MAKLSPAGIAVTAFALVGFGVWAYTSLQPEPTPEELENREPFWGAKEQETNSIFIEKNGRFYSIWEGFVYENFDNRQLRHSNEIGYFVHDFENEFTVVVTDQNSFDRPFSKMNSESLNEIRSIGCEIAQQYFDRAETPDYNEAPADVTAFHQRHCL